MTQNANLTTAVRLLLFVFLLGCQAAPSSTPTAVVSNVTAQPTATAIPLQPTPTRAYDLSFTETDCRFQVPDGVDVRCGDLIVPENRSDLTGVVKLHVAVVPSGAANPAPDPLVVLTGGPGFHTLDGLGSAVNVFSSILAERDLILFDQRGIGYSEPNLDCPEVEASRTAHIEEVLTRAESLVLTQAAYAACRDRLVADGVDLAMYTSAASAADLDDLRQALGYASWNLYGISYGSRLALTALRNYGATGTIRGAVLDSVVPPEVNSAQEAPATMGRAFSLLFERCAADADCQSAYPDLENQFYELVDALNRERVVVVVSDSTTMSVYRIPVDGDMLLVLVFQAMYNPIEVVHLPRLIAQTADGRTTMLSDMLGDEISGLNMFSEGMSISVGCREEFPFNDMASATAALAELPLALADYVQSTLETSTALCDVWSVTPAAALESEPVVSAVPVLLLAGGLDPVTPPAFAQRAAASLAASFYFEFPGAGHGVVPFNSCGQTLMEAFIRQPDRDPDTGCDRGQPFGFVVR